MYKIYVKKCEKEKDSCHYQYDMCQYLGDRLRAERKVHTVLKIWQSPLDCVGHRHYRSTFRTFVDILYIYII